MRVSRHSVIWPYRDCSRAAGVFGGPGAAIAVCFSPEEDCAAFAVRAINNAESEILVSAYGLTTGSGVVEALLRAKQRGVDVRLIADRTTPCERGSGVAALATVGVPVWIDAQARIATPRPW